MITNKKTIEWKTNYVDDGNYKSPHGHKMKTHTA